MIEVRWSYRTTKVAAVLAAVATLLSVGFAVPASADAVSAPCEYMPDGTCIPVEYVYYEQDGTHIFGPEGQAIAYQMTLDMPITVSGTPEHPVVAVDRKQVQFDYGVLPWLNPETNRTLVPIRPIAEAMGFEVTWTPDRPKDIFIEREGTSVHLVIGSDQATVNGKTIKLDQPAVLMNDARTMVPLRFIVEAFGAKVDWVGKDGPSDPRVTRWLGGQYQIWIWSPWGFWGTYTLGDRAEVGNWNLR